MTPNEYQKLTERTENKLEGGMRGANLLLGIAGETGELLDLLKKKYFHGKVVEKETIRDEIGDILWYIARISDYYGFTLEDFMQANIEKLMKRYPEGFNVVASEERKDIVKDKQWTYYF